MGGSSSPQPVTSTTVQSSEPPGYAQPYVKQFLEGAQLAYEDPSKPAFFPGPTYVPASSETETGLAAGTAEALTGSPVAGLGMQEYFDTIGGKYLDPTTNPAFASMVEGIKANVLPGIDSRYIAGGRAGSGLHGRAVGEGLGSAVGGLAYENYNAERNRMYDAVKGAPAYAATRYDDINRLLGYGQAREDYTGRELQDSIARHDFETNLPQLKLGQYGSNIAKGVFGQNTTATQTTPFFKGGNAATGALGGGLTGASVGGGFGPVGAGVGAAAGAGLGAASSK